VAVSQPVAANSMPWARVFMGASRGTAPRGRTWP
jgi:hypothetical protein